MSFLKMATTAPPSTPAAGKVEYFTDTALKRLKYIDETGATGYVGGPPSGWINVQDYGVLPSNSAALNTTNLTALIGATGTAPSGATIYFPGGTYQFNANITVGAKAYLFKGMGQNLTGGFTILQLVTGVTGLFTLTSGNWYTTFENLTFSAGTNQTSGAMVTVNDNVGVNFTNVSFQAQGGTMFNCIDYTGTGSAANTTVIDRCFMSGFTNFGINVASDGSSLVINNTVIQGIWGSTVQTAAAGVRILNAGAVQIDNSDLLGATNNLLINPTAGKVVASVYVTNTYMDNSFGSCLKITGAGATVRCRFVAVSFTTSNATTALTAIEISTTVAAGAQGIDFDECSVLNTFGTTGTTNGFNLTGAADVAILGGRIAGWTNGINVTPLTPAGTTKLVINNNTIGLTGGYGVNTVGILLNAGAVAYGLIQIQNNAMNNTTNITDNATVGVGTAMTGVRVISDNSGLISAPTANYAATVIPLTTVTNVDSRGGLWIPPGARPSSGRITVFATNAATAQTLTVTVRYGTTNASGDTAVFTMALGAGTAVVGSGHFIINWELLSATTLIISGKFFNGNNAGTGMANAAQVWGGGSTPSTIVTNVNNWLGVYFSSAVASAITIRSVKYEVQSQ